ncbi:MAG TPA: hemerythrin domain-containing protein [Bryobacteraceae bacterium]|nr:hemerythrin domain-containing protein [Bryobacteraceae bacterium]
MRTHQSTGRDVAMLIGGVAAGVVGSRLLPPLVAAATGWTRTGEDPFERLIRDHRQIMSILDEMVATPAGSRVNRSRMFLMLKRKLAKHAMAEEDIVYPILYAEGQTSQQSKHLYDEHADMKIFLFRLEELLKSGEDWSEPARALQNLVRRHVEEEEREVFPRLRQTLAQDRRPKISGQIRREEALIL